MLVSWDQWGYFLGHLGPQEWKVQLRFYSLVSLSTGFNAWLGAKLLHLSVPQVLHLYRGDNSSTPLTVVRRKGLNTHKTLIKDRCKRPKESPKLASFVLM